MALHIEPVKDTYFDDLVDQLKTHEGYRAKTYKCTSDKLTIGIGFMVSELSLDLDICEEILKRKLLQQEDELRSNFDWFDSLPKKAKIVLMDMAYNLGVPTLKKFKLTIGYIKDCKWKDASLEMLDSKWARQVGNRATNLSKMMASIDD